MARYIDKEELIRTIYKNPAKGVNQRWAQLLMCILDAPVVDVVPVKYGKWERTTSDYECSECYYPMDYITSYCPNCGAKMD